MSATKDLSAVLELIPNTEAKDFWTRVYSGKFTPQDLANELSDFHVMIENVPKVYMAVTGGLLSKQMYDAEVVIAKFNDYVDDIVQENVKEALEDHAPAREPLSDHEVDALAHLNFTWEFSSSELMQFARAIEKAHGIGGSNGS